MNSDSQGFFMDIWNKKAFVIVLLLTYIKALIMELKIETDNIQDYLGEIPPVIVFNSPLIQETIQKIKAQTTSTKERAKIAFEIARDEIQHSFDTKDKLITINGDDVLRNKAGICFAKAHLLATLLRGMNVPTGFCYQRVLRDGKTVESGYALHGLNAVYLEETGWFRIDPRGNKPGIDSQFTWKEEKLAYPIREELGEKDYPTIFTAPLESVIKSMENSADCNALFYNRSEAIKK